MREEVGRGAGPGPASPRRRRGAETRGGPGRRAPAAPAGPGDGGSGPDPPAAAARGARAALLARATDAGVAASAMALAAGGGLWWAGSPSAAAWLWGTVTAVALALSGANLAREMARRRVGVDAVAVLALAGTLAVGELLAGTVIALMLVSGRALEARASRRARRELSALISRAPVTARRLSGAAVTSVGVDAVRPGDVVLVAPAEVVPLDGILVDPAFLDESPLTGEPVPVRRLQGDPVRSGVLNGGSAFRLRVSAPAGDGTYAQLVRLVRAAEQSRAPLVRMADRFALWFVPVTVGCAAAAGIASQSLARAVAVLVVATPCPLILAAPIALVGGMSRSAHRGVVVKSGAALEVLGRARTVLFDKTGTLTQGRPALRRIETSERLAPGDALWFAASLEQASTHPLARPIVEAAREAGEALALPSSVRETSGQGISGRIGDQTVRVGRAAYVAGGRVPDWAEELRQGAGRAGQAAVFLAVDGELRGAFVLEDPIRPDARLVVERLRRSGIRRVVMVTGDHPEAARQVSSATGLDGVHAECTPRGKLEVVEAEKRGGTVVMVGDGINDAPALAAADVGVAIGARGATASSEVADAVLMTDRIERVGEAVEIARRSRSIAVQSMVAGMALSGVAMAFAGVGLLVAAAGAALQEVIDAAVILNALRAARERPGRGGGLSRAAVQWSSTLREHRGMRAGTAALSDVAEDLGEIPPGLARRRLEEARRFLCDEVLPHERREEELMYPLLLQFGVGAAELAAARREHAEIARETATLVRLLDDVAPNGPAPSDVVAFRPVLQRLHAVLTAHRSAEEEQLGQAIDG